MTLEELLTQHGVANEALLAALVAREDNMADMLRLAGAQFGLYPQIVAEVLAGIGLGSPITDEQRAMIRTQFNTLMQELAEQHRRNNNDNG